MAFIGGGGNLSAILRALNNTYKPSVAANVLSCQYQAVSTGHSHRAPADGHEPQCSDRIVESDVVCFTLSFPQKPVGILLLARTLPRQFTTAAF